MPGETYHRQLRSLLLRPSSAEVCYFPLFVDFHTLSLIGLVGLSAGSWFPMSTRPSPSTFSSSRFANSVPRGEVPSPHCRRRLPQPASVHRHFVSIAEFMLLLLLTKSLLRDLVVLTDLCLWLLSLYKALHLWETSPL